MSISRPFLALLILAALGACVAVWALSDPGPQEAAESSEPPPSSTGAEGQATPAAESPAVRVDRGLAPSRGVVRGELRAESEPLPGVPLRLLDSDGAALWQGRSDDRGRFISPALACGKLRLVVEAAPPYRAVEQAVMVEAGPSTELVVQIPVQHRLALEVVGVEPGGAPAPLIGAQAELSGPEEGEEQRRTLTTDRQGRAQFEGLPSGTYRVAVSAEGRVPSSERWVLERGPYVEGAEEAPARLVRLAPSLDTLSLVVRTADGELLAHCAACLLPGAQEGQGRFSRRRAPVSRSSGAQRSSTDGNGRLSFPRPRDGRAHSLLVLFPQREDLPPMIGSFLPQGLSWEGERELRLPRCVPVSLRFEDGDGEAVEGSPRITWRSMGGERTFSLRWQDHPALHAHPDLQELASLPLTEGGVQLALPRGHFEVHWLAQSAEPHDAPLLSSGIEVGEDGASKTFVLNREKTDA